MMLRGNPYYSTPYNDELQMKRRSRRKREKIDKAIVNILFFLLGMFATVIYVSYFPIP